MFIEGEREGRGRWREIGREKDILELVELEVFHTLLFIY